MKSPLNLVEELLTNGHMQTLAGGYAFIGDKKKAYENLRKYANSRVFSLWEINMMKQSIIQQHEE